LLVSSIGVIPHVEQSISLAPKAVGDMVYLLGETKDELGASEYYDHLGYLGKNVPVVDGPANLYLYNIYTRAARERLLASAYAVNHGGLGVALAKKAIAGRMGLDIDLEKLNMRSDKALYSESAGRIVVTVAPQNKKAFEKMFKKYHHLHEIGFVSFTNRLSVKNILDVEIAKLEVAYKAPLKDY
jgi:phosphoribosylformylglycinamidine synthase